MATVKIADVNKLAEHITTETQAFGLLDEVLNLVTGRAMPLLDKVQIIGGTRKAAVDSLHSVIRSVTKARESIRDEGLSMKSRRLTAFAIQFAVTTLENIHDATDKSVVAGIAWGEVVAAGKAIVKKTLGFILGGALEAAGVPKDYHWLVWAGVGAIGVVWLLGKMD